MRTYPFIVLLTSLVLLISGCERQELSIIAVETTPIASVTTLVSSESIVCEGLMILVQIDDLKSAETFQVAVQSPDQQFRWEHMVPVHNEDHRAVLPLPALLLPVDTTVPTGTWEIEVYSSDGKRLAETFTVVRSPLSWNQSYLALGFLDPIQWVSDEQNSWKLNGLASGWNYRLFSSAGEPVYTIEDPQAPELTTGALRDQAYSIIGLTYDEKSNMYLMIRQQLKEFCLPTATVVDE